MNEHGCFRLGGSRGRAKQGPQNSGQSSKHFSGYPVSLQKTPHESVFIRGSSLFGAHIFEAMRVEVYK